MNKNCEYTNGGGIKSIEIVGVFECIGCGNTFKRRVTSSGENVKVQFCDCCELKKHREDKIDSILK